jgi:hypothetical protein
LEVAGVRGRGECDLGKDCLGLPLLLCPSAWDKENMRKGEGDGRLGCVLVEFAKEEEKRKEKKKV